MIWIGLPLTQSLKLTTTGTYKFKKIRLQDEGFDITKIKDSLYFLSGGKFVPLDRDLFDKINSGRIRL